MRLETVQSATGICISQIFKSIIFLIEWGLDCMGVLLLFGVRLPFVGRGAQASDAFVQEPLHGEAVQRLLVLLIGRAESGVLAVGRYHHAHSLQTAPVINHR